MFVQTKLCIYGMVKNKYFRARKYPGHKPNNWKTLRQDGKKYMYKIKFRIRNKII